MLRRTKIRKYLKINWDISFRMAFIKKSEDEQLSYLAHNFDPGLLVANRKTDGFLLDNLIKALNETT